MSGAVVSFGAHRHIPGPRRVATSTSATLSSPPVLTRSVVEARLHRRLDALDIEQLQVVEIVANVIARGARDLKGTRS
jgi:hypothetical protein